MYELCTSDTRCVRRLAEVLARHKQTADSCQCKCMHSCPQEQPVDGTAAETRLNEWLRSGAVIHLGSASA
jgi:hypothetical protein